MLLYTHTGQMICRRVEGVEPTYITEKMTSNRRPYASLEKV